MLPELLTACALLCGGMPAATIQGVVRAEGSLEPIANAHVTIAALDRVAYTDAHGLFIMSAVPAGTWRVEAAALGYRAHAITIVTAADGTVRLDFALSLRPVQLPGVEVRSSGSESRAGDFVPPPDPGPAVVRMNAAALRGVPGLAEPDVFRALQTLPSVASISDYSSALYVRGGSADQNLITLDGMPLFNPYHVGGLFSAISTDAVSAVELWPGAQPAQLGDRLASVVTINTREGGRDRWRTSGGIGLISANVTTDGPFNGERGSLLVSARRTYLDAITDAAYGLGLVDFTLPYGFSDAYAKATHAIGELGSVSLSAYWNGERLFAPERMQQEIDAFGEFDWGTRMIALNYRQPLPHSLLLHARAGYSDFRGTFDGFNVSESSFCDGSGCVVFDADTSRLVLAHTRTRDAVAAADLTWFARRHTVRAGVQVDAYLFDHALTASDEADPDYFPRFAERRDITTLALYAADDWQLSDRLRARAGLRLLSAGRLGSALLPRFGVRWQVTDAFALTAGGGAYAQTLRTMKDDESVVASIIAYDVLTAQPDGVGLARGHDVNIGAELVRPSTRVRVDAFRKSMSSLVLPAANEDPLHTPPLIIDEFRVGDGSARGIELSARHVVGRFDVGAAYALSTAERSVTASGLEPGAPATYAPRYDRRHQLDASAEYHWGERALVNARLIAASGQPYTPGIGLAPALRYDPVSQRWTHGGDRVVTGAPNSARLPGYMRIDIAARRSHQRRWFGRDGTITPYLQVLNVLNNRNPLIAEAQTYGQPRFTYWPQFPILPTFGVEWRF